MGCVSGGGHRGQGAAGVERWLQCNSVPDTWQLDTEWHFLCWQSRCPVASGPHMWRLDTSLFCEYWPMDQDDLQMYSIKASFSFVPISRHEWDQFYTEDKILQHYRWAKSGQIHSGSGWFCPVSSTYLSMLSCCVPVGGAHAPAPRWRVSQEAWTQALSCLLSQKHLEWTLLYEQCHVLASDQRHLRKDC